MTELLVSVLVFTLLVMSLVGVVLAARALLVPRGLVAIDVNGRREISADAGRRLLEALHAGGVPMPAACGGKGTCGLCRLRVLHGGGPLHPLESDRFSRRELADGMRLACQVTLREDIAVEVPPEILDVRTVEAVVRSSRHVATLLREIVLELPEGTAFPFRSGSFVQVTCPPYRLRYADYDLAPAFEPEWERQGLRKLQSASDGEVVRAYSLANHAGEEGILMLLVRLATPPPRAAADVPPGVASSWLFGRQPGDVVRVTGPYGSFFVEEDDRELVFVGGGAGMAPMRAHILDQLERVRTERPVTFFYGARSRQELLYAELFDRLAAEHPNFHWTVALSDPAPDETWDGPRGFIHEPLQAWLETHPAPEACGFYLCGPPLMMRAVLNVLEGVGVPRSAVHMDDFGG